MRNFCLNSMNLFAYNLNQLLLFIHLLQIIKQCQIILNFLAAEGALTPLHLESIWAAAKLKHSGRYVHDLFPHLIKHLEPELLFHLLKLVSRLHPSEHTEQVSWEVHLYFVLPRGRPGRQWWYKCLLWACNFSVLRSKRNPGIDAQIMRLRFDPQISRTPYPCNPSHRVSLLRQLLAAFVPIWTFP